MIQDSFFSCAERIRKCSTTGGFSYVELIIAIAIFALLNTILLGGYSSLNNRVNVDTIAHNIGQWVRDAQISSMSVRRAADGSFPKGYGLYFNTAQPDRFVYYQEASTPPNRTYTAGVDEIVQTVILLQGYTITSICGAPGGATCGGVSGQTNLANVGVSVSFTRPEPDATISGPSGTYSPVRITVASPKGLRRAIVIYATGQVSIQLAP